MQKNFTLSVLNIIQPELTMKVGTFFCKKKTVF